MNHKTEATSGRPLLSVVVPVYNEQEVLPKFHSRISDVLDSIDGTSEIVYANDGSNDGTLPLLHDLHSSDPRVAIVELSRNFGKEIALTAGLDYCRGETVVVIDADLQDPPELIPELMCRWRDGYDVVYSTRMTREGETFAKRFTGEHSTG